MSYGWLTESALIPKPSKPINVENTSVVLSPFPYLPLACGSESYARKRESQIIWNHRISVYACLTSSDQEEHSKSPREIEQRHRREKTQRSRIGYV